MWTSAFVVFGVLIWYFNSQTTTNIVISPSTLSGYKCSTLNPKNGLSFLNKDNSENVQFAKAFEGYSDCLTRLQQSQICSTGVIPYYAISSPTQYLGPNGGCYLLLTDGTMYCQMDELSATKSAYTQVSYGASTSLPRPVAPNSTVLTTSSKLLHYIIHYCTLYICHVWMCSLYSSIFINLFAYFNLYTCV